MLVITTNITIEIINERTITADRIVFTVWDIPLIKPTSISFEATSNDAPNIISLPYIAFESVPKNLVSILLASFE